MHDLDPGLDQHRGDQAGDAADHIDASSRRAALGGKRLELVDQPLDRDRVILDSAIEQHLAVCGADRPDPVELLGDVDADRDAHLAPLRRLGLIEPLPPDVALQSDRSQCLISGHREAARWGAKPPEPYAAASMKTIPTTPTTEGRAA
jgi:hypothetical protein